MRSCGNTVSIVTRLWIGQLKKFGSIIGRNNNLLLQSTHTGSGTHPVSFSLAIGGSCTDNKIGRSVKLLNYLHLMSQS